MEPPPGTFSTEVEVVGRSETGKRRPSVVPPQTHLQPRAAAEVRGGHGVLGVEGRPESVSRQDILGVAVDTHTGRPGPYPRTEGEGPRSSSLPTRREGPLSLGSRTVVHPYSHRDPVCPADRVVVGVGVGS